MIAAKVSLKNQNHQLKALDKKEADPKSSKQDSNPEKNKKSEESAETDENDSEPEQSEESAEADETPEGAI